MIGFCAAAMFGAAPFTHAQYYVPQDKKTETKKPSKKYLGIFNFNKPKFKSTNSTQSKSKKSSREPSKLEDLFMMNSNFDHATRHFSKANNLKMPVNYGNPYNSVSPNTSKPHRSVSVSALNNCSTKQKNALRSIQRYAEKMASGGNLSLADKKVHTFMSNPDNAQKAGILAQKCGMNLGI
ncbi:hypothetical protein N9Z27_01125 [Alphaproteobacteria bacterium]|nr:hypothetical protein [Alphaproteobacteria bacterium]